MNRLWSHSIVARLMLPVAMMAALVALLGVVSATSRARLNRAYGALTAAQDVRYDLAEARSLSRSLQRDVLALIAERDTVERAVLRDKFAKRSQELRAALAAIERFSGPASAERRSNYFKDQAIVLDRLAAAERVAARDERGPALEAFRRDVRPHERAASKIADQLIAAREAEVRQLVTRVGELEQSEATIRIIASLLLLTLASTVALLIIMRTVVRPLSEIERAIGRVADGDVAATTPHAARRDEIGRMAAAIEVFRQALVEREILREAAEQARATEVREALEREQARRVVEQVENERARATAALVANLETQVASVLHALRGSAAQLSDAASDLANHSGTTGRDVEAVEQAASRAADGASDIAAATSQFISTLDGATARARRSAELSSEVAAQTARLMVRMDRVRQDADNVGRVIELVRDIAKRTNLLALNATIEAERVGDVGAGFAVVAGEVKLLARRSAEATGEIAGQLAGMQTTAAETFDGLTMISAAAAEMANDARELASHFGEQAASGGLISRNVDGAAGDLGDIRTRLTDLTRTAHDLRDLAGRVRGDAGMVEDGAATLDDALQSFFAELDRAKMPVVHQLAA